MNPVWARLKNGCLWTRKQVFVVLKTGCLHDLAEYLFRVLRVFKPDVKGIVVGAEGFKTGCFGTWWVPGRGTSWKRMSMEYLGSFGS